MDLDIGFSISDHPKRSRELAATLTEMLARGCSVVELAPVYKVGEHYHAYDPTFLEQVCKFKYRSIHLPIAGSLHQDIPSAKYFSQLIDKAGIELLTFHPTEPANFAWLDENFGALLSAENMDCQKDFGRTPEDMMEVFAALPNARWTFDVNHLLTNDPSLKLGQELMNVLGDRLARYHVSGYGGPKLPHTLLAKTRQKEILSLITKKAPIIIESFGEGDIKGFKKELVYITDHLTN